MENLVCNFIESCPKFDIRMTKWLVLFRLLTRIRQKQRERERVSESERVTEKKRNCESFRQTPRLDSENGTLLQERL